MQILEEKRRDTRFSRENNKNTADQEAQRVSRARQPEAAEGRLFTPPSCTES